MSSWNKLIKGRGKVRFQVSDPCGSAREVWLVGLLDGLFRSWGVSCLEGGDVGVGWGDMLVEGGYFLDLRRQGEEVVGLVRKRLVVQKDELYMVQL